jgi:hypothetical protein
MLKNEEFLLMTASLISWETSANDLWCSTADYSEILPYRDKIQEYLSHKDRMSIFEAFFNMSINQFFAKIA